MKAETTKVEEDKSQSKAKISQLETRIAALGNGYFAELYFQTICLTTCFVLFQVIILVLSLVIEYW